MAYTIRIRRDSGANWSSTNPTLALGEMGYNTTNGLMKIGDGSTAWNSLSYMSSGTTSLSLLTDIQLTSVQNNDVLQYNTATGKWVNSPQINLTDGGNF